MIKKYALWCVLSAGMIFLLIPMALPPLYVFPSLFSIVCWILLLYCSSRAFNGVYYLVLLDCVIFAGLSFAHFDSIQTNYLFSWEESGLIGQYVPLFQMAICIPVVGLVFLRRHFKRNKIHNQTERQHP